MAKKDEILERIGRQLGGASTLEALSQLAPRDLHSLLLHLHAEEAAHKTPQDLLTRYAQAPLFSVGFVDPRLGLRFATAAFEAASAFEAIELSPVCPLGTINAISGIHQNNVLSASRGAEIISDPTPVLALECARRRRQESSRRDTIRLATHQRLIRMQPAPPGLLPHFRLFGMVTAAQRAPQIESDTLREHLDVYLRLFAQLGEREFRFDDVTVSVSHTGAVEAWLAAHGQTVEEVRAKVRTQVFADPDALLKERGLSAVRGRADEIRDTLSSLPPAIAASLDELDTRTLAPLQAAHPRATIRLDLGRLEGLGYYQGPCVRITARDLSGTMLPLVDGGYTRWTQRLLGDERERFLITGIGSDLACARYRDLGYDKAPGASATS